MKAGRTMNVSGVWILVFVYILNALSLDVVISGESCETVQRTCFRRTGCGVALKNFFHACKSVTHGTVKKCTVGCKRALISLLTTEDRAGSAFMNCDCKDNQLCQERKQRVEICTDDVIGELDSVDDNTTRVSCTLAQWTCEADTSCYAAFGFYVDNCQRLISGDKCTAKCNNSLNVLHQQFKAKKLQTCSCDGTEDYDCERVKAFTEELCYHRTYHVIKDHKPSTPNCRHTPCNKCDKLSPYPYITQQLWLFYLGQIIIVFTLLKIGRTSWSTIYALIKRLNTHKEIPEMFYSADSLKLKC